MHSRLALLARLPGRYGYALFLREAGLDDAEIALRLDEDLAGARMVLRIAEAKCANLLAAEQRPT